MKWMNKIDGDQVVDLKISLIDKKNVNKTVIEELYMVTDAGFKGQSPWSVDHVHSIEANNSILVVAAIAENLSDLSLLPKQPLRSIFIWLWWLKNISKKTLAPSSLTI